MKLLFLDSSRSSRQCEGVRKEPSELVIKFHLDATLQSIRGQILDVKTRDWLANILKLFKIISAPQMFLNLLRYIFKYFCLTLATSNLLHDIVDSTIA